jgi:hypothetical protein
MEDLSLHVLDVAQNSVLAHAKRIEIRVDENPQEDRLTIEIVDDGVGMDEAAVARATDPFVTSRPGKKVGLGLALLAEAARAAGGDIRVESCVGKGTTVRAWFAYSHVDRQPLGRMGDTVLTLVAGHPEIDLRYEHVRSGETFVLDTADLKLELGSVPITDPAVLSSLRRALDDALKER